MEASYFKNLSIEATYFEIDLFLFCAKELQIKKKFIHFILEFSCFMIICTNSHFCSNYIN